MKKIVLFIALIAPSISFAEPFLSLGFAIHGKADKPEIGLQNPLGIVEAGYRRKPFVIKYTHVSGITQKENGYGLNMISVQYEVDFK